MVLGGRRTRRSGELRQSPGGHLRHALHGRAVTRRRHPKNQKSAYRK